MSDQAAEAQTTTEAPAAETAAPDPMAQLLSRMDELQASIPSMAEPQDDRGFTERTMQQFQPQEEQQPEQDGYEQQYEQDGYGQDPQAEQRAYQELQQLISDQVRQGVQAQINPFIVQQQAQQLEQKYPDLAKPEVVARVMAHAEQFAQQLGMPELAGKPQFIEKLYLAERAESVAAQETPADGETGVRMESGGAQPQQPVTDERDRIVGLNQSPNTFGWM